MDEKDLEVIPDKEIESTEPEKKDEPVLDMNKKEKKSITDIAKKNPLLVIGLIFILGFLIFFRPRQHENEPIEELPPIPVFPDVPHRLPGLEPAPVFGGIGEVTGDRAPQPMFNFFGIPLRENVVTQPTVTQPTVTPPTVTQPTVTQPTVTQRFGGVLDYSAVGHQAYQRQIQHTHATWQPGTPTRQVDAQGRLATVAHGFQTPQQIIDRQLTRFQRAMAEGRTADAQMVRQETEITLGQRVNW